MAMGRRLIVVCPTNKKSEAWISAWGFGMGITADTCKSSHGMIHPTCQLQHKQRQDEREGAITRVSTMMACRNLISVTRNMRNMYMIFEL